MPHFYNAKPLTLSGEERLQLFLLYFNIGLFTGIRRLRRRFLPQIHYTSHES